MTVRAQLSRSLTAWALVWLTVMVAGAWAKGADPASSPYGPTMRIVIVRSLDATCGINCPEWISAEGAITSEVPAAFQKIFKQLGTRKLPILVHSPGGDLASARRIAREIRRHHLDVIVARTWFEGCGAGSATCPADHDIKGLPISYGAVCASACSLVFAGGEHRYVPTLNRIGVHRPHRVTDGRNGRVNAAPLSPAMETRYVAMLREEMTQFFVSMGVSDHIVDLSLETPSTDIRWLTRGQLLDLKLVTNLTGGDGLIAELRPKEGAAPLATAQSPFVPSGLPQLGVRGVASPYQAYQWTTVHMPSPTAIVPSMLPSIPYPRVQPVAKQVPALDVRLSSVPSSPVPLRAGIASVTMIDLNDVYSLRLTFGHNDRTDSVLLMAEVFRFGIVQTAAVYELRLELPQQSSFVATALPTDLAATQLRGNFPLKDYCTLAKSDVHLRLFVPSDIGRRETTGVTRRILTDADVWPACRTTTPESASATH